METGPLAASPSPLPHGLLCASWYGAREPTAWDPAALWGGGSRGQAAISMCPSPTRPPHRSQALPNPLHEDPGHGPAWSSGVSAPPRVCNGVGAAWEGLRHAARRGCCCCCCARGASRRAGAGAGSCSWITGPCGGAAKAGSLRAAAWWLRGWLGRAPGTLPCAQGDAGRGRSAHAWLRGCQREREQSQVEHQAGHEAPPAPGEVGGLWGQPAWAAGL